MEMMTLSPYHTSWTPPLPSMSSLFDLPSVPLPTQPLSAPVQHSNSLEREPNPFEASFSSKLAPLHFNYNSHGEDSAAGSLWRIPAMASEHLRGATDGVGLPIHNPGPPPLRSPVNDLLNTVSEFDKIAPESTDFAHRKFELGNSNHLLHAEVANGADMHELKPPLPLTVSASLPALAAAMATTSQLNHVSNGNSFVPFNSYQSQIHRTEGSPLSHNTNLHGADVLLRTANPTLPLLAQPDTRYRVNMGAALPQRPSNQSSSQLPPFPSGLAAYSNWRSESGPLAATAAAVVGDGWTARTLEPMSIPNGTTEPSIPMNAVVLPPSTVYDGDYGEVTMSNQAYAVATEPSTTLKTESIATLSLPRLPQLSTNTSERAVPAPSATLNAGFNVSAPRIKRLRVRHTSGGSDHSMSTEKQEVRYETSTKPAPTEQPVDFDGGRSTRTRIRAVSRDSSYMSLVPPTQKRTDQIMSLNEAAQKRGADSDDGSMAHTVASLPHNTVTPVAPPTPVNRSAVASAVPPAPVHRSAVASTAPPTLVNRPAVAPVVAPTAVKRPAVAPVVPPTPVNRSAKNAPLDPEAKRQIALEKNREAASKCRQKRKVKMNEMQVGLETLSTENNTLEIQVAELEMEIAALKMLFESTDCRGY
ncbi:hypothetical protein M427DRAFT_154814 [Gonapodya prolifera JEL478]|uniref:BZIP domain-containing protein n=1 Tax=Gonapodya prolifera (strain JEL478) TaxID=1344416 RepID=A0A139AH08_GONPJ|nr:hypothetical protein M427DRAFT_154814 [Gonapodya prolifera JEL478]|eukprot:KXS16077.1 hypothetical protein M427DRAFT_154814 [Gonapodya prolifera JEL478]